MHPFPAPAHPHATGAGCEHCPAAPELSHTPDEMLHPWSIPPGTWEAQVDEAEGILHSFAMELELPLLAGPTLTGL